MILTFASTFHTVNITTIIEQRKYFYPLCPIIIVIFEYAFNTIKISAVMGQR